MDPTIRILGAIPHNGRHATPHGVRTVVLGPWRVYADAALTTREIADCLGISVQNVRKQLKRVGVLPVCARAPWRYAAADAARAWPHRAVERPLPRYQLGIRPQRPQIGP